MLLLSLFYREKYCILEKLNNLSKAMQQWRQDLNSNLPTFRDHTTKHWTVPQTFDF